MDDATKRQWKSSNRVSAILFGVGGVALLVPLSGFALGVLGPLGIWAPFAAVPWIFWKTRQIWKREMPIMAGWQSVAERLGGDFSPPPNKWEPAVIVGSFEKPPLPRVEYRVLKNVATDRLEISVDLSSVAPWRLWLAREGTGAHKVPLATIWNKGFQTGDDAFDDLVRADGMPSYLRALFNDDVRHKLLRCLIDRDDGGVGTIVARRLTVSLPMSLDGVGIDAEKEDRIVDTVDGVLSLAQLIMERSAQLNNGHKALTQMLRHNAETDECQAVRHNNLMTLIEETPKYLPPWPMTEEQALHVFTHSTVDEVILRALDRLETVGTLAAVKQLRMRIEATRIAAWLGRAKQVLAALEDRVDGLADGGLSLISDVGESGDLSLTDGGVDAGALDLIDVPTPENSDQGPESHQAPDGIKG